MNAPAAGRDRFTRFAWATLIYNVAVVAWGAYVRATGSGAGCGSHWPLCNGEVIPKAPALATLIEFSHRATSGVALLLVVALAVWAVRRFERLAPARRAAIAALVLMLLEAAIGAALVLFELVADNESMARAMFMATHLVNTFLLLAALTLTAFWSQAGNRPRTLPGAGERWRFAGLFAGMLLVGVSGAVSALGDTLYPSGTLAEGLAADLSVTSHLLIRLRILHPLIAVVVGLFVIFISRDLGRGGEVRLRRRANQVSLLVFVQLTCGLINVALLAPVWLQLVHLLLADLVWITLVLLLAERMAGVATATAGAVSPAASRA